jgi:hypothetical protein
MWALRPVVGEEEEERSRKKRKEREVRLGWEYRRHDRGEGGVVPVSALRGDRSDELLSASTFSDREKHHPSSLFNTLL